MQGSEPPIRLPRGTHVSVVGVGYVGLPLALALSGAGYPTSGYDANPARVAELQHGIPGVETVTPDALGSALASGSFVPTIDPSVLCTSKAIFIAVPTPLGADGLPDTSALESAVATVADHAGRGVLIILESTSYPGTTRRLLLPKLASALGRPGEDFLLACVPERIDPASHQRIREIPRLIGGLTPRCGAAASALYSSIVAECHVVSSPETAEMAKLLENSFRNVNIALVSEFWRICERVGVDVYEAIRAAATKPFGFMPFYPGVGVGGECIPVDPVYLAWFARSIGEPMSVLEHAISVNNRMPVDAVDRIEAALRSAGVRLPGAPILVLGVTYKPNVRDTRNSAALRVITELQRRGAVVSYHDPLVPELLVDGQRLASTPFDAELGKGMSAVVVLTAHPSLDYTLIRADSPLFLDLAPHPHALPGQALNGAGMISPAREHGT